MTSPGPHHLDERLTPWKLPAVLFLLSFATVMFTIVLFRLLTFFIMPSLFFDLLFIGFPLGALVGVYFFLVSRQSFLKTLWVLQGAMLFSILAMLACKHFDYLRAHLFDVELQRLFYQMLIFTLFFLPFFIAYGLSEYIGYQMGRRLLRGRMPVVYAIYLFGAAGAYLFAEFAFPLLGATRLLGIPLLLVAVAMAAFTRRPQAAIAWLLNIPGALDRWLRHVFDPHSGRLAARIGHRIAFVSNGLLLAGLAVPSAAAIWWAYDWLDGRGVSLFALVVRAVVVALCIAMLVRAHLQSYRIGTPAMAAAE